ncbi:transmembrane 9 superfamily member 1-like [Styela clava]|uniref:transmembrane 9 superfamily member 1-like n=1 Tax=Styela clava TaxID=7725 RepID=UPI001939895A|nr:transmembrane 9 superfamily member 1-like [Styela clava]
MNILQYFALWVVVIATGPSLIQGMGSFKDGDNVDIFVNKVGPYFNPHETYHYYSLPVCRPDKIKHRSLTLGEVLDGDRMAYSLYEVQFGKNKKDEELCTIDADEKALEQLRDAVEELYYFEMVADDLPMRSFIGRFEETGFLQMPHIHKLSLYNHITFRFTYNGDKIISANATTKGHSPLSLDQQAPMKITYKYSVEWTETKLNAADRSKLLKDYTFFPRTLEIHWLSIINSVILVSLLMGFIVVILTRVLRNDFTRYNKAEDDESAEFSDDDNGWKIIHADVFRFPPYKSLFCSILGVGTQLLSIGTGIICMALLGMFKPHRHGSINTAAILLYALTSCVAGYVSSSYYRKFQGANWVSNIVLTSALFTAPFFAIWSIINTVHWIYGSTQALPFTTVLLLAFIWVLVGFPLTVVGGILGKNTSGDFDAPCRTKNIAREIPPQPWYRMTLAHMVFGGFLPFSAISVELYYIFATVWGREVYTLYGVLLLVFGIVLSVSACISVALTYFQLSSEDFRWWWRSIFSAGSTGFFVFIYASFFYFKRSNMSGTVQSVEFFGYTLLTCFAFFLMLGTVSFFASLKFIRYIYVNLKMD